MTTSKLPEWPEEPATYSKASALDYHTDLAEAALARMEALVEYAQHHDDCDKWCGNAEGDRWVTDYRQCTCGLSELLAACARKEAGK